MWACVCVYVCVCVCVHVHVHVCEEGGTIGLEVHVQCTCAKKLL